MKRLSLLASASLILFGCAASIPDRIDLPLLSAPGTTDTVFSQLKPGKFEGSIMAIGSERDLAQEQGRHLGLVRNVAIEAYLNKIRDKLLAASGINDVPGSIQVVADTSYSARATADGNVFISMAWLPDVESEDELAAILAHELAHVLLKHQSTNLVGLGYKRLQSMHELSVAARLVTQKTNLLGAGDRDKIVAAQVFADLLDKLAMPAWNRRQETESDLLGMDLMIRAGYAPEGMTYMLERLRNWETENEKRNRALQDRIRETSAKTVDLMLQSALAGVVGQISREHPDTDHRLDSAAAYLERHYGNISSPEVSTDRLKKVRAERSVGPVLKNYQHSVRAKVRLLEGKHQVAYREALLGTRAPTAKDTLPNWILWQTAKAVGKQRKHQKALKIALHSSQPTIEIYREAVAMAEQSGRYQAALDLVVEAGKQFGDSPEWMPDRIRLLRKLGRKTEASTLAFRCSVETPQLRKECHEAGKS